jgi:hypothetical protein
LVRVERAASGEVDAYCIHVHDGKGGEGYMILAVIADDGMR